MNGLTSLRRWRAFGLLLITGGILGCPGGDLTWREPPEISSKIAVVGRSAPASGEATDESVTPRASDGTAAPAQAAASAGGTAEMIDGAALRRRVAEVLRAGRDDRQLSVDTHAAWQVMHGVLAYGREFRIQTPAGAEPAVTYALEGGPLKGFLIRGGDRFETPTGTLRGLVAELDPGQKIGQGHRDQWLAYLARCELNDSDTIQSSDGPLTLQGWIRQVEWDVPRNFEGEYSWTLTALIKHRPTTHSWIARDGQRYSIESLLSSEMSQLAPTNACGGSHRLCAIATAVAARRQAGLPMTGVWSDAEDLLQIAIEQVRQYQNADGTFSSRYFDRPGWSLDLAASLGTTGHAFEFLMVAASDDLLREPWVNRAAAAICEILEKTADVDLECGALYHALSGLVIYDQRTAKLASL